MAGRAKKVYDAVITSPAGRLGLSLRDGELVEIDFLAPTAARKAPRTPAARRICAELAAYARDGRHRMRIPLQAKGTAFQRRVWRALQRIPSGTVVTYGTLAARLSSSPRAIGGACRANPIPVVVPCHRVVARQGVGGFMGRRGGAAIERKRRLLAHEASG